jgi:hypothetical protein
MKLISYLHLPCIGLCLLLALAGCDKIPLDANSGHYLRFSNATATVTNKQGATRTFTVESDITWQLTVSSPAPDWMVLNKNAGNGTEPVTITATRDNNTGGYRFAEVIATAVNDSSMLPVRLTVVQYDSTYKIK